MDSNKHQDLDFTSIFSFFFRWWMHIAIVVIAAAVLGAIFSSPFFITPMFQAKVSVFPASTHSVGNAVFNQHIDYLEYGEIEEAERLIEILESSNMKSRIIERFNLFNHYELDETVKYPRTYLLKKVGSNVNTRRTKYGAVELSVKDKDPEMAAVIANEMIALLDTILNEIRIEKAMNAYNVAMERYEFLKSEVDHTEDSLRTLMQSGVFEPGSQAMMYIRQQAQDISSRNHHGYQELDKHLANLREYGSSFVTQRVHLEELARSLARYQGFYLEAKYDVETFKSYFFLLDEAEVPERKSYPVRWLIVFLAAFAAGFMGIITLMSYEILLNKGLISNKK